jgi:hypothetical protein
MMASIGLSAARDRLRGSSVAVAAGGTADADDGEAGFGRRMLDRRRGTVATSSLALLLVLTSAPALAPFCLTAPRPREAEDDAEDEDEDEAGWATRRSLRSPLEDDDEDDDEDRSHRPLPLRRAAVADVRDADDEFDERDDEEEGAGLVPGGFRRQVRSSLSSPSLEEAESP